MTWHNWSGSVAATPQAIRYPTSEAEIVAVVRECSAQRRGLRVVGSGHSFTPLVQTENVLLSLDRYQGIESIDFAVGRATIRAGTKIKMLGEELFRHGLAQENLGDIDVQSIAGAISTGTHGTGIGFGSISTQVAGLRLITAAGEVLECSEEHNREIFKAAQVSLGALGVISAVTLRVQPAYRLEYSWKPEPLDQVLQALEAERATHRNIEFYWMPYTNAALVKRMNVTERPARSRDLLRELYELAFENGAFWLFSEFCRLRPSASRRVARLVGALSSGGETVNYSHRIYATPRFVRFQEMEYNLPVEAMAEVVREIAACIERERFEVHFPIECRFVGSDDILLSPAYGRDSAYIAVHMYRGMPYQRYFAAVEAIFRRYGGRPHWGKHHTLRAGELRELYPCWDDFLSIRRTLDPQGLFLNPYLRELFGV